MSNFLASLQKSLDSAMSSKNEQAEIDTLLGDLNRQVRDVSYNLAGVKIEKFNRPSTAEKQGLRALFMQEVYNSLTITWKTEKDNFKEIAEWQQENEGYPVRLTWQNVTHTCANKEALENLLMKIVSDTAFGIVIRDIVYAAGKTFEKVAAVAVDDNMQKGRKRAIRTDGERTD